MVKISEKKKIREEGNTEIIILVFKCWTQLFGDYKYRNNYSMAKGILQRHLELKQNIQC